jgi:hypothetical protein
VHAEEADSIHYCSAKAEQPMISTKRQRENRGQTLGHRGNAGTGNEDWQQICNSRSKS